MVDSKTMTVSALQALTGQVTRKLEEGSYASENGLVYHFRGLTDIELGWLRGKCYEANGELNSELLARWVIRVAWTSVHYNDELLPVEQELLRFNGPTPQNSGYLSVATWPMVEAVGMDTFPLSLAILQHTEQTEGERVRLGFTDGSCTTDSPAASHTPSAVSSAGVSESASMTP